MVHRSRVGDYLSESQARKAAKMVGIVLLVGGLAALFALLYFTRPETKATGLLHATAGTLSIGIPALITIGFLMAGKVFLGIGCAALMLFTVNMFFPLWRHIRGFLPDKIQKPYEGKGRQNRPRQHTNPLRNDRSTRRDDRQTHR
jgi:hypothetical protein